MSGPAKLTAKAREKTRYVGKTILCDVRRMASVELYLPSEVISPADGEAAIMQIKHLAILGARLAPCLYWLTSADRGIDYSLYKDHKGAPCCDDRD